MSTALDLITGTLLKLGEASPGETLAPEDANGALQNLNGMLDLLSNEHLAVYNNTENIFNLVPGKGGPGNPYTIGTGGDVNIPRPLRITNMYSRITTTNSFVDFGCEEVSGDIYTRIGLKTQPGPWPKKAYYNTGYPLAQLYLWPLPSQVAEFHMWTDQLLVNLALNDTVSLPQGYFLWLQYELAVILGPEYGLGDDDAKYRACVNQAARMRKVIKATNARPASEIPLDVAEMTRGNMADAGWILHGGFQ